MTEYVSQFLDLGLDKFTKIQVEKGIYDFCYKYPNQFIRTFLKRVGLSSVKKFTTKKVDNKLVKDFANKLKKMNGESIFLLIDTYDMLQQYQQKNKKGFGILVNRKFVCGPNEENYFKLIDLVYRSLQSSTDIKGFQKEYLKQFKVLLKNDKNFHNRAKQITDYVESHRNQRQVVFVDTGFQYTLSLFCYASMKIFSNYIKPDYYAFTTYPWLQKRFKNKYYSTKNELGLDIELQAIKHYQDDIKDKSKGAAVGFAIGDSLGFPVAGIDRKDVSKLLRSEIKGFQDMPQHPYFFHLKPGQYTDNTNSLIISAQNIIRHDGFEINSYTKELIKWGKQIMSSKKRERWVGPTLLNGIKKLISGSNYKHSGSTTTKSCSSTYRVIPVGIYYRGRIDELKEAATTSGMISHNSDVSKTGTTITALIIAYLLNGDAPVQAVTSAMKSIKETSRNKLLFKRLKEAVKFNQIKDINYARKYFGTGSSIYQTLPLAVYCFLKYQNNFEKAILAAANSYRDDTSTEKKRLAGLSWEQQLLEAKGGNTDGIAGLTGAFCGAYFGLNAIPKKFVKVENKQKLEKLGEALINKNNG